MLLFKEKVFILVGEMNIKNEDSPDTYLTLLCMYLIIHGLLNWLKWSTGTANAFILMLHVTLEMAG